MSDEIGTGVIKVTANVDPAIAGLKKVESAVDQFVGSVEKAGASLTAIGAAAAAAAASIAAMFAPAIIQGAEFEKTMSTVRAVVADLQDTVAGAGDRFSELSAKAQELGANTQFSATEAAQAMSALGQAGFTTTEILAGIDSTLALAAAGEIELGRAAEIAADNMNAFGLAAADINRVADTLAITASASSTGMEQIAESLKYVAPVAAATGQSIEDVSVAIGILANNGLKGSIAGTSLAMGFSRMLKKADQFNEVLQKYGSSFAAIDPEVNSIIDIIKEFQRVGLGTADVMKLFGVEAGKAFLILKNTSKEAMAEMESALANKFGAALDQQAIRMDNLLGAWDNFKSAIEGTNITIFEIIKTSLRDIVNSATEVVQKFDDWAKANQGTVQSIAKMLAVVGAVAGAIGAMGLTLGPILLAVGQLVGAWNLVATAIGTVTAVLGGPIWGTLAVAAVAVVAMAAAFGDLEGTTKAVATVFEGFSEGVQRAFSIAGPMLGKTFDGISETLNEMMGSSQGMADAFNIIAELMTGTIIGAVEGVMLVVRGLLEVSQYVVREVDAAAEAVLGKAVKISEMMEFWTAPKEKMAPSDELREMLGLSEEMGLSWKEVADAADEQRISFIEIGNQYTPLIDKAQKFANLIENSGNLTELQAEQLDDLMAAFGEASVEGMPALSFALDDMKLMRDELRANGQDTAQFDLMIRKLEQALNSLANSMQRVSDAERVQGKGRADIVDATQARVKQLGEITEAMERVEELNAAIAKQDKKNLVGKTEAKIAVDSASEIDKEIVKTQQLTAARLELLETTRAMLIERDELERFMGAKPTLDPAELLSQIGELDMAAMDARQAAAEKEQSIIQKAGDERAKFIIDQKIAEARASDDKVKVAELEAEKLLLIEKRKIDELFQLRAGATDKEKAEMEKQKADALAQSQLTADAMVAGARKQDVKPAKERLSVEEMAAENLAKQVTSASQLLQLYAAMAMIRQAQERAAVAAAEKAFAIEKNLMDAKRQAALRPQDQAAQDRERWLERLNQMQGGAAGKPGMGGMVGPEAAGQVNEATAALKNLENAMGSVAAAAGNMAGAIAGALGNITGAFAAAPGNWVGAFIDSWVSAAQQMVEAVRFTMSAISYEMEPTTRHSPSLVDVWKSNLDVVQKGLDGMAHAVTRGAPNLSAINISSTMLRQPSAVAAGGVRPTEAIQSLTDNRKVTMTINSNYDLADVQRQIGRTVGRAIRSAGQV